MSDRCERRFNNGIYLLTCELNKGHGFHHMDGEESWEADEGFDYIYEGGVVVGTTLPKCEERLDINTRCCEPAEQGKRLCRYHGPQVPDTGGCGVTTHKPFAVAPEHAGRPNKTIAERLAERKALNASLTKPKP